jgi:hypothetical protein
MPGSSVDDDDDDDPSDLLLDRRRLRRFPVGALGNGTRELGVHAIWEVMGGRSLGLGPL